MDNRENIKRAFMNVRRIIGRTWEKNAPLLARELIGVSVDQETRDADHRNITGNMITSIVAGEYAGSLKAVYDYDGKKAVRGMLTRGEVFDGITWDGPAVKFRGSVDTSGAMASEENMGKLSYMHPSFPYSLILLRGTPYANQLSFLSDSQLDNMTDLLTYAKGFLKIVKAV